MVKWKICLEMFFVNYFVQIGSSNYCSGFTGNMGVCHPEMLSITLIADRVNGYGLNVSVGEHTENRSADILITRIIPESPAYR